MAEVGREHNRVVGLVNGRVVAFKPRFSYYHIPTGKFGYVECEIFQMLVDLHP